MATNTLLTNDVILKEGMMQLEDNLVIAKLCNRDFEPEFGKAVKNGDTIRIARPIHGQVRTGAVMQPQDITEGRETLTIATQLGADLEFTSKDLTLSVDQFSKRILKPQMIRLATEIDLMVMRELSDNCPNWVGTPGQTINSYADFALAPQRLDELSVPSGRVAILSPADHWGLVPTLAGTFIQGVNRSALERAKLPMIGDVDMYMSQNVTTHTNGTWSGASPIAEIDNGTLSTTYAASKDTWTMTIHIDGLTANTGTVLKGDVITIENVYAVNTITGATLPWLREFVVKSSVTADGTGDADVTISPPIITSGPYMTCNAAAVDGANITLKGSVNVGYPQNLVFHPDAVTLAMPNMEKPKGAAWCEQQSYEGFNLRLTQGYDMTNDKSQWRFDCLVGVKAYQPWLATRVSGSN
ncbi:P22 phage major capsid protein family protein [Reyranella sp.]|uniref:P22 phage major capsid protein family protein n=1 Tax=Reyranella sp. TaxID=1929291 RepID=UPI0012008A06|nr:P22 phage major capsid protein family protein [Reyranella sp.]TAJ89728.1 MAG: hypothetical protein EPO50_05015 [Reyranella sp.]